MAKDKMLVVADDKIPGLAERLQDVFDLRLLAGEAITRAEILDAGALLIRAVTRADADLLAGTSVKFVGSATAGFDHVDLAFLESSEIEFVHAPGANAPAVCDYVLSALFDVAQRSGHDLFETTVGIVGVGNVGGRLARRLEALGIDILLNDPPRQETEPGLARDSRFVSLDELVHRSSVVTLHVPLTDRAPYPTRKLVDAHRIRSMGERRWLINTSRGGVVDETALLAGLTTGRIAAIVDVWTDEPHPDCRLVEMCDVSTPHIAGYGLQSKNRATAAIATALLSWAGFDTGRPASDSAGRLPLAPPGSDTPDVDFCASLVRQAYDVGRDHLRMQGLCTFPAEHRSAQFTELRRNYRYRHEFSAYSLPSGRLSERQRSLTTALGFNIQE